MIRAIQYGCGPIGCWVAESEVADSLAATEKAHPGCQIGSYPFFREGKVGANFVVRSADEALLAACISALVEALGSAGYPTIMGGI